MKTKLVADAQTQPQALTNPRSDVLEQSYVRPKSSHLLSDLLSSREGDDQVQGVCQIKCKPEITAHYGLDAWPSTVVERIKLMFVI